ncbi:hypothetical protein [Parvularcula maris]|uniref:Uncharacterized protein n=1 Tax=Parvularcula maris TaxID=2965077 RepID=A0A9X2LAC9_9PROT|nr:hypothetical protein [Parvularcula maris]MCQ8186065.1 hypothetical protein [Parvularcula maris]
MTEELAALIWLVIGGYFAFGLLFGLVYVSFLAGALDEAARGMKLHVRLTVLWGVIVLWPIMLWKTVRWKGPPAQ